MRGTLEALTTSKLRTRAPPAAADNMHINRGAHCYPNSTRQSPRAVNHGLPNLPKAICLARRHRPVLERRLKKEGEWRTTLSRKPSRLCQRYPGHRKVPSKGIPALRGCVNDIRAIAKFLRKEFQLEQPRILTSPLTASSFTSPTEPTPSDRRPTFDNIRR